MLRGLHSFCDLCVGIITRLACTRYASRRKFFVWLLAQVHPSSSPEPPIHLVSGMTGHFKRPGSPGDEDEVHPTSRYCFRWNLRAQVCVHKLIFPNSDSWSGLKEEGSFWHSKWRPSNDKISQSWVYPRFDFLAAISKPRRRWTLDWWVVAHAAWASPWNNTVFSRLNAGPKPLLFK